MNPAHVFLISLAVLAVFWLGVYCGSDASDHDDFGPIAFCLGFFLTAGGIIGLLNSLSQLIAQAL